MTMHDLTAHDIRAIIRDRLLHRHGSMWKAAATYGKSSNWLAARLSGDLPMSDELCAWLESETGLSFDRMPTTAAQVS